MNTGSEGTPPVPLPLQQTTGAKRIKDPLGALPKKKMHLHECLIGSCKSEKD
jgi:hypothetical protein